MTNPSNSAVQNLLPVQAYFNLDGSFNTFIGQGTPFYATANPIQSGLTITNSTLDSSPIGSTSPSTGVFTNIATTTGTITTQPTGANDIVNLLALQSYAAGISWKQPCAVATLTNITLSGLQTIDGYTTLAGDRVLVKDQSTAANNGIYLASATAWTRSLDANVWDELVAAISFIEYGTQKGGAWFCTAQPGGTLGVTAVNWSQFTTSATYTAGTGLTLTGFEFSITNTGVPASTYGSATATPVFAVNAQGQITGVTNTTITPAIGNVTGLGANVATWLATPTSANLAAAVSDETGSGALVFATSPTLVTPALGTPASGVMTNVTGLPLTTGVTGTLAIGNGGTGQTTATAAFNALNPMTTTGDIIYESSPTTAARLGIGSTGQVLTVVAGLPAWSSVAANVSSFSAGTTGLTPSTATTGVVTLAGTLVAANGGTGFASYTVGDILYASTTTALSKLAGVATGNALISGGVGAAPSYGKIDLTTTVSGILPGANGGTGNGFFAVSGPATALKTFTFPNASATVLTTNAVVTVAQGGTGVATLTGLAYGNGTSAFTAATAAQVVSTISTTAVTNATNAANLAIVDDTTTNATVYPVWSNGTTGNQALETSSTRLSFNPSTGTLAATTFSGSGSSLTGISVSSASGTLPVANGGTGQTSYTNGQLLIGNTTGNTLTKATLTAGAGIIITNGAGSITIRTSVYFADYLIAAGGGGGGGDFGGGGGAGGLITGSNQQLVTGTTYSFTVGAGGAGSTSSANRNGSAGNNSTAFGLTAIAGGYGGGASNAGGSGGSGGGGSPNGSGGSGTSGQGNTGGNGTSLGTSYNTGGGGGASAVGGNGSGTTGGAGGAGTASSITGSSVTYAGGGGGMGGNEAGGTATIGTGGAGGGGNGGANNSSNVPATRPQNGTANTGGGGGGASNRSVDYPGGNGGSGVVILSVPTSAYSGTTTGSPTVTTSGSNTIIKFTASGSYTA